MLSVFNQTLITLGSVVVNLPNFRYGEEKLNPYWGPVTATINWCEEDYYLTQYCAEIVNSLTNIIFICLAIRGMRNCYKEGHDVIFFVAFMGYFVVGVGSFLFHSTLWYSMQLVDELSMIYSTSLMMWASFTHGKSLRYSIAVDPKFHQDAFGLMTVVVLFRSFYLMESNIRAVDPACVNHMWRMVAWGISVFLAGYGLWMLDNIYCGDLRGWRRSVGMPWGFFLEGHGWWHLLTGVGAYYELMYGIYLRYCLDGRQNEYRLVWKSVFSIPDVRRGVKF
ncbi:ceramidase [Trichophaea hybrida]|nr:ceramidase [Trichophaea hybrida]